MIKYLKKYKHWCLLAPLFMLGEISMDLIQPDMMRTIVDNGVLVKNMSVIISMGIKMIILVIFGGLSGILCGVFANLAAQKFGNDLRKDLFKKIMNLSFEQTDTFSTGSLVTRITNDVSQVQNMVMMLLRGFVRCGIMFFGGLVMLYHQSPKFSAVTASALPFIIVCIFFFMKKASPMFSKIQSRLDDVNSCLQEDIVGARVVKAYVKEKYELNRFDCANDRLCSINLKVSTLLAFMPPCMNLILNICVVMVIFIGGITVKSAGEITTGEIMAAITYVSMILHSIIFMANIFQTLTRAKASKDRIFEVLEAPDIITDGKVQKSSSDLGKIEFRNVSFAYPNSSGDNVLSDINLIVHPGETLAILGATGSGKSSLVNLITRFFDATTGEVLVDDVNVKDYTISSLRKKITIVLQNAELYSRSIEENIRWGQIDATPCQIKNAAQIAQADDFILKTEHGYYTHVSERGHSLSGGQKQRLSIARAMLKGSEIMIFDDSTSALDFSTESQFYSALNSSYENTTKIIIAQRVASIGGADRIIVLDNGKIKAEGTHDKLIKSSEIYQDIYYSQQDKEDDLDED